MTTATVLQFPTEQTVTIPAGLDDDDQYTDLANADRLITRFRDTLRYVKEWGWLVYDGKRWVVGPAIECAKETVHVMSQEATDMAKDDARAANRLWKHVNRSCRAERLRAMVELAESDKRVTANVDQFDQDPWLLNCQNWTLNLRTGETHLHTPTDLLTRLCPVDYLPYEQVPQEQREVWEAFVYGIMCKQQDMVNYLQRAIGYSLTGETREKGLFFCYGPRGDNGKSTLLEAIRHTLGGGEDGYAQSMPPKTILLGQNNGSVPNDLARLVGKRFVTAVEPPSGQRLNMSLIKQLTGSDTIPARFMRQEFFDFRPVLKLWLAANDRPEQPDSGDAAWGRIWVVPFNAYYPKGSKERDESLPEKLRGCAQAILGWAVQGCQRWQEQGLNPPEPVREAMQDYREDQDPVSLFIREECQVGEGLKTTCKEVKEAYQRWAVNNEQPVMTSQALNKALEGKGYPHKKTDGAQRIQGLCLLTAPHTYLTDPAWKQTTVPDEDEDMPF